MSQNQFENLMQQYSTEAADELDRRHRAEKRRKLFRGIFKVFVLLLLVAAAAGAWVYRAQLGTKLAVLKLPSTAEMKSDRKAQAEGKAVEAQKLGQKRVDEFESTLK